MIVGCGHCSQVGRHARDHPATGVARPPARSQPTPASRSAGALATTGTSSSAHGEQTFSRFKYDGALRDLAGGALIADETGGGDDDAPDPGPDLFAQIQAEAATTWRSPGSRTTRPRSASPPSCATTRADPIGGGVRKQTSSWHCSSA